VSDSYAFAQTSAVCVVRNERRFTSVEDAKFLAQTVDAIGARAERARWRTPIERARFRAGLEQARRVYERIAQESPSATQQ
jgi:hypothetical protein